MSEKSQEIERLYNLWINSREDKRFLIGWLYSSTPIFRPTIEGISAYMAYRNLPEERRIDYALYSSYLFDLFFTLSKEELEFVERNLPPYPYISELVWRNRNVSKEEIEILKKKMPKNPIGAKKLIEEKKKILEKYGLIPDEYKYISEKRKENDWKESRKVVSIFYGVSALETYLLTHDINAVFLYLLTFPIPYHLLKYFSLKHPDKNLRRYIDNVSLLYLLGRSPTGLALSTLEYAFLSPMVSKIIEKYWYSDKFPDYFRKLIYKSQILISGLRTREFDEREIREQLYSIKLESSSIPKFALDRFKEEVDNKIIEIEDPRKVLLHPWAISWFRRKVVAVPKGKEIEIVDKEFVRKLAKLEGIFLNEMEEKIRRQPTEYLGLDVWKGRIVFTRDVLGILPCQIDDALTYKEGYTAILGKKADRILIENVSLPNYL
jgi:hypothetical protein